MTHNKAGRKTTIKSVRDVPAFSSEDDERDWWAAHDLSEQLYDQLSPQRHDSADGVPQAVEIIVRGLPPVFGSTLSMGSAKHPQAARVAELQRRAKEVMRGRAALAIPVVLAVRQTYAPGAMPDAANVIGAISNALEGIVYTNDSLIREIHFQSDKGRRKEYKITIVPVASAAA
jgi:hypothetical protein